MQMREKYEDCIKACNDCAVECEKMAAVRGGSKSRLHHATGATHFASGGVCQALATEPQGGADPRSEQERAGARPRAWDKSSQPR